MVYAMQSIEGLISSFYAMVLQQKIIKNLQTYDELGRKSSGSNDIQMSFSFINSVDNFGQIISRKSIAQSSIFIASILTVFLLTLFFYLVKEQKRVISNHYEIVRGIGYQLLGTLLLIFSYVLYIPLIDIVISNAIYAQHHTQDDSSYIAYLVLSIYSICITVILVLYTRRFYKLNMISGDQIASWSQADSRVIYFELINKIIMPIVLAFDREAAFIQYEVIFILISQASFLIFILMFSAPFNRVLVYIQMGFQVIIVFLLEIGVLKFLIGNRDNKEGIIFLFFFTFNVYSFYELRKWRERKLLLQFQQNKLQKITEYEQVFLILINLAQNCINELMKGKAQKANDQMPHLYKMIEQHMVHCGNAVCLCNHYETFIEMFKVSYQRGQGQMLLNQQKFHLIYDIMFADQRYAKFYTSISRTLPNPNGLRDAEQNYDYKEDKTLMAMISQEEELESEQIDQIIDQEEEDGEEKTFILDQIETQKFFIINFIKIFLDEIRAKFPDSMLITNSFNYYTLFLLEKPQLSLISLKHFSQNLKNPSWIDLVSQNINEHYILYYYEIYNSSNKDYQNYKIDAEAFISINNLYSKFHQDIEDLSLNTISFWKGFTFDQLDPFSQIKIGEKISTQIKILYDKFLLIERTLTSKDPKLYLWFALVQQKIINDNEGYQIFINKMKEVNQMKKLLQLDFKVKSFDQESGFILVDGKTQTQGQILMMNKSLRRAMKRDEEEVKFLNINSLMPSLIEAAHQKFMDDYSKTGQSKILNKKVMHFCKDKNANLIPIEALVKFHYSQFFNYCFVSLIDPVIQMRPFRDDTTYQTNQLLFFSIDWNNGQITESSENFSQLVKKSGISSLGSMIFQEKVITLDDIFENLHFRTIKNLKRKYNKPQKNFHEGIYKLDLFEFNDEVDNRQIFNQNRKTLLAKIAIYYESYGNDYLKMGYVAVSLDIGANEFNRSILTPDHNTQSYNRYNSDHMMKVDLGEEETPDQEDNQSSAGSSDSGSSRSTAFDVKSFHSFYQQSTPRILKIVLQMVILLFLASLTISTVNLGLSIQNQIQSSFEIKTVKAAYDRINHTIGNRMIMRILLNIANGFEPNSSKLIADRFTVYKQLQDERITELKATQQFLDNSGYPFDDEFLKIMNSPNLRLTYLNERNQQYTENVTMKVAQSLLLSRLQQINQFTKAQMKGNLRIQTLTPIETSNYVPKSEEQTLFFAVINANGVIREHNWIFMDKYVSETKDNTELRLQQSVILTILSVITILIVSLVISPIISKTEERKYNALIFFLRIPKDQINVYIQRCEDCLKLEEESNLRKRGRGTFDQTNNGVERENISDKHEDFRQNQPFDYSQYDDNSIIMMNPDVEADTQGAINQSISNEIYSTMRGMNLNESNRNILLSNNLDGYNKNQNEKSTTEDFKNPNIEKKKTMNPQSKNLMLKQQPLNQSSQFQQSSVYESDYQSQSDASQNESVANLRRKKNIQKDLQEVPNQIEQLDQQYQEEQTLQREIVIKKIAMRQKVKTFLSIIALTLTCSFYFIATFLLSQNNYNQAATSVDDLGVIFSKDMCYENLINFLRENAIRNESIVLTEDGLTVASQYYMTNCYAKETNYRNMRRNLPPYFSDVKSTLDKLESPNFCDDIYGKNSQYYNLNSLCKSALNGLFFQGLSSSLALMYQKAQKIQLDFDTAQSMKIRDQNYLKKLLNDSETIEILDSKAFILQHAFTVLKDACVQSSIKYFQSQRDQLIIIYVIFLTIIVVSILIFFLYALKKLRSTMWNTNLMLKIIPQDVISKKDVEKIRSFFVN
eukprot:403331786